MTKCNKEGLFQIYYLGQYYFSQIINLCSVKNNDINTVIFIDSYMTLKILMHIDQVYVIQDIVVYISVRTLNSKLETDRRKMY